MPFLKLQKLCFCTFEIAHFLILEHCATFKKTLYEKPDAPDEDGNTPIYWAAFKGHTDIVKILAPLIDNPNAPNDHGVTPSKVAYNAEIRTFLKSFNTSRKRKAGSPTKPSKKF